MEKVFTLFVSLFFFSTILSIFFSCFLTAYESNMRITRLDFQIYFKSFYPPLLDALF